MTIPCTQTHQRAAGATIVTMMCGHIVVARIDALIFNGSGDALYNITFLHHFRSGATTLWLDFGADWSITQGDKETTEDCFIDSAIENIDKLSMSKLV